MSLFIIIANEIIHQYLIKLTCVSFEFNLYILKPRIKTNVSKNSKNSRNTKKLPQKVH